MASTLRGKMFPSGDTEEQRLFANLLKFKPVFRFRKSFHADPDPENAPTDPDPGTGSGGGGNKNTRTKMYFNSSSLPVQAFLK